MLRGSLKITPVKWGREGARRKETKKGGIGIGQLKRAEEAAETGRKINTGATVSGWTLRYTTTCFTVLIDSFLIRRS